MNGPFDVQALLAVLADHLWQSTWIAAGAALVVWLLRHHRANVRAAVWFAAALKFLIPFAAVAAIGRLVPWPEPPAVASSAAVAVVQAVSQPFTPLSWDASPLSAAEPTAPGPRTLAYVLVAIWATGSALVLLTVIVRSARYRRAMRLGDVITSGREADAVARIAGSGRLLIRPAAFRSSPCVIGVWHPTLVWPEGLSARLSDAQLDAVVQHELCHVTRRDNLSAIAQAAVQSLFWFHPIVWLIGGRWNDERERACDEHVLAQAHAPEPYAESLINIGEFCVTPTVAAHATLTGSRLVERIEAIMNRPTPKTLGWHGRTALALVAVLLLTAPVWLSARGKVELPFVPGADVLAPPPVAVVSDPPDLPSPAPLAQATPGAKLASVGGSVVDQTGASVAGVTVTFTPAGSAASTHSTVTDIDGRFSLRDVPAGEYDVRFAQRGFRTVVQRANIRGGYSTALTTTLPIGSLSETVTLTGSLAVEDPAPIPEGEWQQRLNSDPENVALYLELAELYYKQGRNTESENLVAQARNLLARTTPAPVAPGSMAGQRGSSIKEPRKLKNVQPVYPRIAVAARVAGPVVLEATIGRDGLVQGIKVVRSVPLLDSAAVGAVRLWRFTPTLLNGHPIDVTMTATINFTLPQAGGH